MKLRNIEILGIIIAILTIAVILVLTTPFPTLLSADFMLLLSAGVLFATSLFLWSFIWIYILWRGLLGSVVDHNCGSDKAFDFTERKSNFNLYRKLFVISIASLIGFFTPMNIGTDILRSFYGKRYIGIPLNLTAASSVLTRTFKLHVTLLLAIFLALSSSSIQKSTLRTLIISIACLILVLIILYSLRTNYAASISNRLKIGDISEAIRTIDRRLGFVSRVVIYLAFAAGFVLEWLALYLCFMALDVSITLSSTFVLFVLLYFLSRVPIVPQGFAIVELSGFAMLKMMGISTPKIGALLVVWGFIRVFIPAMLSGIFSVNLFKTGDSTLNF